MPRWTDEDVLAAFGVVLRDAGPSERNRVYRAIASGAPHPRRSPEVRATFGDTNYSRVSLPIPQRVTAQGRARPGWGPDQWHERGVQ